MRLHSPNAVNLQHFRNNKIMTTLEKYKKTLGFISPVSPCWFNKRSYHSIACSIESVLEGTCFVSGHLLTVKDVRVSDEDVNDLAISLENEWVRLGLKQLDYKLEISMNC